MFHVHFVQRKKSVPGNENELWMTLWIRLWSSCSRLIFAPKSNQHLAPHIMSLIYPSLSLSLSLSGTDGQAASLHQIL